MNPNILLSAPPASVRVGEDDVAINYSHRVGIQVMRLMDDVARSDSDKLHVLLFLYFGKKTYSGTLGLPEAVVASPARAVEAAVLFFNLAEPRPPDTLGSKVFSGMRLFDWDWDAGRVLADFQREYGIDLSDGSLRMHWWRFWSLFQSLSEDSQTMRAISVRGAVPNEKEMGRAGVEDLMRRKMALMLPARTLEEAAQLTSVRFHRDFGL